MNRVESKHSLASKWALWFFTNENKNWHLSLIKVTDFSDLGVICRCMYDMKKPSELKEGQDYAVFREGISPKWEDPANKSGGRWVIHLNTDADQLDINWFDMILEMIAEKFCDINNVVCGASVNIRPKINRIALWTRTLDKETNMAIGRKIQKLLCLNLDPQYCADQQKTKVLRNTGPVIAMFYTRNN